MIKVTTGPAEEPISLAEAKLHLRVTNAAEDGLITSLMKAARQQVEVQTSRVLVTQTLVQTFDEFPCGRKPLVLRRPPVQAITSIQYIDTAGDAQTLTGSRFKVSLGEPTEITPAYGYSWPSTRCEADAVTVAFVAGFGGAAAVPELAKAAIKLILGHLYENREAVVTGTITSELPLGATHLISQLKWGNYQ